MMIDGAQPLGEDVWSGSASPNLLKMLGTPRYELAGRSVLLVDGPQFDGAASLLRFDAGKATVLNLGTTDNLIVLGWKADEERPRAPSVANPSTPTGDSEYLGVVRRELRGPARQAAEQILAEVRKRYPGDLQRGQRLNFKDTPDNFWYVVVQPRVQSLSITVRGAPSRFEASGLELKMDRPGYTRFALKSPNQLVDAVNVIEASKRKV